jgi:phosphoribosylanthranilate isomerase
VFVREPPENIAGLAREGVIALAQLHGGEDGAYLARLKALTDVPVIRVVFMPAAGPQPPAVPPAAGDGADFLLFDSGPGGTGKVFDWNGIGRPGLPFFLAGGLHVGNVLAAARYRPYALDISSGVETGGVKDPEKIIEIVRVIRNGK